MSAYLAAVDMEAGVKQKRMILEPTLPIYLKVRRVIDAIYLLAFSC